MMLTLQGGARDGDSIPFKGRAAELPDRIQFQRIINGSHWIIDDYERIEHTLMYRHASERIIRR